MKVTLNQNKLAKSLQYASKAVSVKPNIPVLSNLLLDVDNGQLKISATNLDIGINVWIAGVVESDGSSTVSAKYIADFVSASSSEKIDIELKDSVINVKTQKSKANFSTIPANEFPPLPKSTEKPLFKIDSTEFVNSIEKVGFACSTDLSAGKIQQTGVLFEFNESGEEVSFIGLDGFRLSVRTCKIKEYDKELKSDAIIVPARYLNEVVKIIQDYEDLDEISIFLSENKSQIMFKFEDVEISLRLIEGPYPDYKKIIPDSTTYSFEVNKADLEESIKIINTFARSNLSNKTLFDFDIESSAVKMRSSVAEVGENETIFPVMNPDGQGDLNTAYNLRFIQDAVAHIKGDTIHVESKGPLSPTVFKDKSDVGFLHLLMPLRRD